MNSLCRKLVVVVPVREQDTMKWLKKKSQEELCVLQKHGNPQDVIAFTMALTSQLNQVGFTGPNMHFTVMEKITVG